MYKIFCLLLFVCLLTLKVNGQTPTSNERFEKWHVYYVAVEKDSVFYFGFRAVEKYADGDSIRFRDKSGSQVKLGAKYYFISKEQLTNKSVFEYKRGIN
jgi:hypothetical protein